MAGDHSRVVEVPRSSRAVVFHGAGRPLELVEIPLAPLGCGEILVRVGLCTLCGSDLHTYHGRRKVAVPTILGHEIIGTIAQFGPQAPRCDVLGQPLTEGDRISWSLVVHCGECFACRHHLPQKCQRLFKFGHEALKPGRQLTGGLAEFCVLPKGTTLVRLPAAIPDAVACPLSCATATVAAALRLAGDLTGAVLAIVGAGTLGLIASAMARSQGVACVLACDVALERGVQAARFGVEATATPADFSTLLANRTEGRGADVILELSGSAEGVELALEQVRTGGRVILVGSVLPVRPVTLLPEQVVRRCLTIQGIHNYTPDDLVAALRWLTTAQQLWPLERLVGPTFPLEQTKQAFAWASTHSGFRVAIAP